MLPKCKVNKFISFFSRNLWKNASYRAEKFVDIPSLSGALSYSQCYPHTYAPSYPQLFGAFEMEKSIRKTTEAIVRFQSFLVVIPLISRQRLSHFSLTSQWIVIDVSVD